MGEAQKNHENLGVVHMDNVIPLWREGFLTIYIYINRFYLIGNGICIWFECHFHP